MIKLATLKHRETILEVLVSKSYARQQNDAFVEQMIYGTSMGVLAPKSEDVVMRPYRPKLP